MILWAPKTFATKRRFHVKECVGLLSKNERFANWASTEPLDRWIQRCETELLLLKRHLRWLGYSV